MPVAVLIPMTVMTMAVMTMTGKSRWRDQQRGGGSGDQEEFANQGIFLQVVSFAYERSVRRITKLECCE